MCTLEEIRPIAARTEAFPDLLLVARYVLGRCLHDWSCLGEACDLNIGGSCEFSADLLCVDSSVGPSCVHNAYHSGNEACNEGTADHCSGLGACVGSDGHLVPNGLGTCNPAAARREPCGGADELCQQPALCFNGACTSPVGVMCQ